MSRYPDARATTAPATDTPCSGTDVIDSLVELRAQVADRIHLLTTASERATLKVGASLQAAVAAASALAATQNKGARDRTDIGGQVAKSVTTQLNETRAFVASVGADLKAQREAADAAAGPYIL